MECELQEKLAEARIAQSIFLDDIREQYEQERRHISDSATRIKEAEEDARKARNETDQVKRYADAFGSRMSTLFQRTF